MLLLEAEKKSRKQQQDRVAKIKGSKKSKERKSRWGILMSLKMDSTSYVWRPQHAGISHTVTGPRTQSWLSSAPVWLFTWLFVVIRKKKSKMWGWVVPGARDWSMGTWLVYRPGPWGETSESRGSRWSQGAWVWDWVWADLLCNVNPWGIRSCNRRGEVAARSLGMLTLCIPPP